MKMTIQTIISKQLKQMMKNKKMTLRELSTTSGVPSNIVSKIMSAKSLPEIEYIEKLCNVFNMSVCHFFDIVINDIYIKSAIA